MPDEIRVLSGFAALAAWADALTVDRAESIANYAPPQEAAETIAA